MPLVRLIILFFRGIGWVFQSVGRLFKALFSAGMFAFLTRSFDALLRLGFIGSLIAAGAVCWKLYTERPFVSAEYDRLGMPSVFRLSSYNSYSNERISLETMLTRFIPKDSRVVYGPGKLDAETFIQVWNANEMVHVTGEAVVWQFKDRPPSPAGPKPMLKPEDFSPSRWNELTDFFQATWAILTLPLVVAWLVFPGSARLRDRIFRACLWAPACVVASFSFAYLLSLQWLSVQHAAYADLILDLPRWVQPAGLLNMSLVAGFSLSLVPVAVWYLIRWVLGPFLRPNVVPPTP